MRQRVLHHNGLTEIQPDVKAWLMEKVYTQGMILGSSQFSIQSLIHLR
jgi:hypothetical protein